MLKSPGSASRMALNKEFYDLGIIDRILYNKYSLMNYTYTRNAFVIIIMLVPIFYNVFSKIKSKKIRWCAFISFILIPILTIINSVLSLINLDLSRVGIEVQNNLICFISWICFTVIYIISIFFSKMDKENKINTLFMFLIGAVSICSLLVTPVFGDRASFFSIVTFVAVSLKLISYLDIKPNKHMEIILKVVFSLFIIFYLIIFIAVAVLENKRVTHIKNELDNKSNNITIKSNPIPFIWNNNPTTDFHIETFKKYYKIPNEVNLHIEWIRFGK